MTDKSRDELVADAEAVGLTVPKSWSKAKIETEIVKARQGSTPEATPQVDDPGADDRMRRFSALDAAERLGVAVGEDWSTDQIESAVAVVESAARTAPPRGNSDGYDEFPDGAASPRG